MFSYATLLIKSCPTHCHATPDELGNAGVDIFRLDSNGKIVEHWDVSMPAPEKTVSGCGVF